MQHTLISPARLTFWALLVLAQAIVAMTVRRRDLNFLRNYLAAESLISGVLWILSRTIAAWPYFYSWCVAEVLDQALAFYLLFSITTRIRLCARPGRNKPSILAAATFSCFALGIYTSGIARSLLQPSWAVILSWDHAFWAAASCYVGFLPLYTLYTFSTMRGVRLIFASFAVYIVAHAGLFDLLIVKGRRAGLIVSISDCIYALCIFSWYFASRDRTLASASGLPTNRASKGSHEVTHVASH